MIEKRDGDVSFEEFFTAEAEEEHCISAMRIRIDYGFTPNPVTCRYLNGECEFHYDVSWEKFTEIPDSITHELRPIPKWITLNAFAIRKAFEEVRTESDALRFLSHSGPFWLKGNPVSWRQFQELQELVNWVRQEDFTDRVLTDQRAMEAMEIVSGMSPKLFSTPLCPQWTPEHELAMWSTLPTPEYKAAVFIADIEFQLRHICGWFLRPPRRAFSVVWDDAEVIRQHAYQRLDARGAPHEFPAEFSIKDRGLVPILRIGADNVLEAIAATVYADRCHGIKFGKCEFCGRLFKRESDHGQKYCRRELPDGRVLESCKNAATQKALRDRMKKKKLRRAGEKDC